MRNSANVAKLSDLIAKKFAPKPAAPAPVTTARKVAALGRKSAPAKRSR